VRGNLQVIWRANDAWLASLGLRHTGDMYNRLENDDFNGEVYGAVSGFTMLDARLAYTLASQIEVALGIDNITNERSYQSHPLQMRTAFLEARWSFTGDAP
jgi:iron complex outermembrane receptor protein